MKKVIMSFFLLTILMACGSTITTENEKFKDITVVKKENVERLLGGYKAKEVYLFTIKDSSFKSVYVVGGVLEQKGKYYTFYLAHTGTPNNIGLVQSLDPTAETITDYPYGGKLKEATQEKAYKLMNKYIPLFAKENNLKIEY